MTETYTVPRTTRFATIASEIDLPPQFRVIVGSDERGFYYQIACERADTYTGKIGVGTGSPAYLSLQATDSQLVQTIWALFQSYVLHEAREGFLWRGRRVFGPHILTEALWEVAERVDHEVPA